MKPLMLTKDPVTGDELEQTSEPFGFESSDGTETIDSSAKLSTSDYAISNYVRNELADLVEQKLYTTPYLNKEEGSRWCLILEELGFEASHWREHFDLEGS